jgi:hypothetical protein
MHNPDLWVKTASVRNVNVERMLAYYNLTKDDLIAWLADNGIKPELTDSVIERISDEAEHAARHVMHACQAVNPYPVGSQEAEMWSNSFRSAYARQNGL